MSEFTPGPWVIGKREDGTQWFSLGDPVTGPHRQADIYCSEADARLIAAAPEMHDALKECVAQIEYLHVKFRETGSGNGVLSQVRAILAKIDGDQS